MAERDSEQTRQDGRIEPIADWQRLRFRTDEPRSRIPVPRWRDRTTWRWGAALALLLIALVVMFRQPLANLFWPDTRIQQLLDQGGGALRAGRLSATDGTGARQYFEAAQALDNDRSEARDGLARVATAALAQAREATRAGRLAQAHASLALAVELQVPRADAIAVADALRQREAAESGVESLLQRALAAQAERRLDGTADAALPLFQRVLALQPNRLEALEGREDAISDLLQQATAAIAGGDLAGAGRLISAARGYDSGHVDLPAMQASLARAIDARLARADNDLRRARLVRAAEGYRAVLAAIPEEARARQGVERVAVAHAEAARRAAGDFRFAAAEQALQRARELAPQSPAVRDAEQAIVRARATQATLDAKVPPRERARRLDRLLAEMAQAETHGDWLTPPGESAYDKLRAAQALAPDDARVKQAAARLLPAVRQCFEQEWSGNRLRRAQACLSAWQTVRPGDAGLPDARRRMAQKWIAIGDERLGGGDVAFAAQSLAEARALDPRAPGLEAFAERVRMARRPGND